jgi:predicted dehydrogenase
VRDPTVDVVYVASVADHHFSLATMALRAGKATVVEKPLTINYKATIELIQLARQQKVFLM